MVGFCGNEGGVCRMNSGRPESLGKTIEVKTGNRPIKIAYLVPCDETSENHMIVDAVFNESYTRWAGVYTLIIPTTSKEFLHPEYKSWMDYFDPDFLYTYLDLELSLIRTIETSCSPIAFLRHDNRHRDPENPRWRDFTPEWGRYFSPLSSITTVQSPHIGHPIFMGQATEGEVTIATQFSDEVNGRVFRDNFGNAFHIHMYPNPIHGLFRTFCLAPPDLAKYHNVGTERCASLTEMLSAISTRKALPIAAFAKAHSEAIPRAEPYMWSNSFNLFIGSTLRDRIHFWNARHFTPSHSTTPGTLILAAEFFNDEDGVVQLGQYLNRLNFLGQSNSPARVTIRSYSHTEDDLIAIREKLIKQTYNQVSVDKTYASPALPDEKDLKESYFRGSIDTTSLKLTEDTNSLIAKEPSHLSYLTPRFKGLAKGQWIIELDIQRHNNLSKYSNVVDTWVLPRRRKIVQAFTRNLGKVTSSHRLAVLPTTQDFPFGSSSINEERSYNLSLPDDESFFRYLLLDVFKYSHDDLRASLSETMSYKDMEISDKGENLRGVISMFRSLSDAYDVLTKKYWREVLRAGKEKTVKSLVFTREQLEGFLPNDRSTKEKLMTELRMADIGKVTQYMESNLTDTLEYLIRLSVFYYIHQWRCEYCGHTNSQTFDKMKIRKNCEICSTEYLVPIDLQWTYQLNDFVFRSLVTHTGLPVLWTLGFLHGQTSSESFWYLPEADLYESYDAPEKQEIDVLCVRGGQFIAAEVKLSATQLINNPEAQDSFVKKMNLIQPDIAILSFERYCDSGEDVNAVKASVRQTMADIQKRLGPNIKLEIVVAMDVPGFNDHSAYLGYFGRRTDSIR